MTSVVRENMPMLIKIASFINSGGIISSAYDQVRRLAPKCNSKGANIRYRAESFRGIDLIRKNIFVSNRNTARHLEGGTCNIAVTEVIKEQNTTTHCTKETPHLLPLGNYFTNKRTPI